MSPGRFARNAAVDSVESRLRARISSSGRWTGPVTTQLYARESARGEQLARQVQAEHLLRPLRVVSAQVRMVLLRLGAVGLGNLVERRPWGHLEHLVCREHWRDHTR